MRGCFRSIINIQAWGKLKLDFNFPHAFFEIKNLKHISFFTLSLCCRTVLIALRETCIFTTARAATFVAAKAARVPHGRAAVVRRRRSLTNGDSRDKAACIHGWLAYAFVRLRRPKAPLREPFLPLLAPLHAALPCGGGSSLHSSLRSRLRRSRLCSTRFHNTTYSFIDLTISHVSTSRASANLKTI